jgi:hypothetical protein
MQQCIVGNAGNVPTMKNTTPIELSKYCCPFCNGYISWPEALITPKFLFYHLDVPKLPCEIIIAKGVSISKCLWKESAN